MSLWEKQYHYGEWSLWDNIIVETKDGIEYRVTIVEIVGHHIFAENENVRLQINMETGKILKLYER